MSFFPLVIVAPNTLVGEQMYVLLLFIAIAIAIAAAEVAIGLAILLSMYSTQETIALDAANKLSN